MKIKRNKLNSFIATRYLAGGEKKWYVTTLSLTKDEFKQFHLIQDYSAQLTKRKKPLRYKDVFMMGLNILEAHFKESMKKNKKDLQNK